jgi:predicted nucleic acid-binding protein
MKTASRTYWDSSALVEALHDETLRTQLERPGNLTRPHSFAEVFSTLTGGRLGIRYSPNEAAEMIASLAEDLEMVDLSTEQTLEALSSAHKKGVRGGQIHDYLHAVGAFHAGATILLTTNGKDFKGLINGLKIVSP